MSSINGAPTPPQDGVYVSFDKLLEYLNDHLAKQGYAITIKRSKKKKKQELRKVWLQCDKGGESLWYTNSVNYRILVKTLNTG